jgi:hypothetical protein
MFWNYSRSDTKLLLLATLILFAGYALLFAQDIRMARVESTVLTAQSIGVFAAVPETETNKLAMELARWEEDLATREAALASAERVPQTDPYVLLLIAGVGIGLLGLILLNFYLDHKRRMSLS